MVRQSSIKGAMKSEPKTSGGCFPKCIIVMMVFLLVYLLSFVAQPVDDDNLRSGQANLPINKATRSPKVNDDVPSRTHVASESSAQAAEGEDDDQADAKEYEEEMEMGILDDTVNEEFEEIDGAETNEMDKGETALNQAATDISNTLSESANKLLLHANIDQKNIQSWTSLMDAKVQETVDQDIHNFDSDAKGVAQQTKAQIRDTVDEDFVEGFDAIDIIEDLEATEGKVIDDMKSEIQKKATYYQKDLQAQALQIEKDILEQKLSAKYGHAVTLVVVHDELEYADDGPNGLNRTGGGGGNETDIELDINVGDDQLLDDDNQTDIDEGQRQHDVDSYLADDVYGDDDTGMFDDDDVTNRPHGP